MSVETCADSRSCLEKNFMPRTFAYLRTKAGLSLFPLLLAACELAPQPATPPIQDSALVAERNGRSWLAGDHHIHSQFSADYEADPADPTAPPKAMLGVDGRYPIPTNAAMARRFGLAWMVSTDHGGPQHSKLNHDLAYPELERSRREVPEVIQFYGMEFDTPGGDHSSLIIPHTHGEREALLNIEERFSERDAWPLDPSRDAEPKMLEALRYMSTTETPPVVIANHPSRSATEPGGYGQYDPAEFRDWSDTAPDVAIGMEGAPGHQAGALEPDGSLDPAGSRGGYRRAPTLGGFDQMTARLGGFWDSMLGEGRRWLITSTSDSHRHFTDGGSDFWPGEYSKTYVFARRTHDDILAGLRSGRVFVTTGDLISELEVIAYTSEEVAHIGDHLHAKAGQETQVMIRVRDPSAANAAGRTPSVRRVDLIVGEVTGKRVDRDGDTNPTTRVAKRFAPADWERDGEYLTMNTSLGDVDGSFYLRVRGTSTQELEPLPDPAGEDPWSDLWFYSNPIFVNVR